MIPTWENPSARRKNLSRCHFVHRKPHTKWPEIECEPPRREGVVTNRMSHDMVCVSILTCFNYVAVFNKQKKTAYIYFGIQTGFMSYARNSFCTFYFTWSQLQWRMLQRTAFINEIRLLQRTQVLQGTRRNTIDRRSKHVRMTCRAFPL